MSNSNSLVNISKYEFNTKYRYVKKYRLNSPKKITIKNITKNIKGYSFYIIEFDKGIKIGVTGCIRTRISPYLSPWCGEIKNITIIAGNNIENLSKLVEMHTIRYYKTRIDEYSREFIVNVDYSKIENTVNKIFTRESKKRNIYY